jgi:hypothetical protein
LGYSGALRSAATVFVDDPMFGPFAYGGDFVRKRNITEVIPKDGLRERFHIVRGKQRLHILLDRDGFAKDKPVSFDDALSVIRFTLENRATASHEAFVRVAGLVPGTYQINSQGHLLQKLEVKTSDEKRLRIPVGASGASVSLERIGP